MAAPRTTSSPVVERCAYCEFVIVAPLEQARQAFAEHVCDRSRSWDGFTALFTAVGGVGAGVGGIAAWQSASASKDASRDALRAHAAAIRPHLDIELQGIPGPTDAGNVAVRLTNTSTCDVRDVEVEAIFGTDGDCVMRSAASLRRSTVRR
jgi:hypothetical protein